MSVSKIVELASQFASQNCFGCHSKLNLGCKFHAEVVTHLSHIKLRTLYIYLEYYINWNFITINCDLVHDLSSNFHTKIATYMYKIISDTV